jgi:hypothetical protein
MTHTIAQSGFSGGSGVCIVAVVAALMALGGCGTTSTTAENPVPISQGARDTGTYPNLNIKPDVAAQQFTDAEKTAKLRELQADRANAASLPGTTTEAADAATLGHLAATHGDDTLKQIEAKCDPALDPTCK